DTGGAKATTMRAAFDSMIAKIIAYGRTRAEALARLRRAMAETTVVIEGGATNKSFILDLLDQSEVVDGNAGWADTAWIDRARGEGRLVVHQHSGIAVVAAGIEAYEDEKQVEVARLLESAHGGGAPARRHTRGAGGARGSTRWAGRSTSSSAGRRTRSRCSRAARAGSGSSSRPEAAPRWAASEARGSTGVTEAALRG